MSVKPRFPANICQLTRWSLWEESRVSHLRMRWRALGCICPKCLPDCPFQCLSFPHWRRFKSRKKIIKLSCRSWGNWHFHQANYIKERAGTKTQRKYAPMGDRGTQEYKEKIAAWNKCHLLERCVRSLTHLGQEHETLWKEIWQKVTRELKMFIPSDPLILLLGFHPNK